MKNKELLIREKKDKKTRNEQMLKSLKKARDKFNARINRCEDIVTSVNKDIKKLEEE